MKTANCIPTAKQVEVAVFELFPALKTASDTRKAGRKAKNAQETKAETPVPNAAKAIPSSSPVPSTPEKMLRPETHEAPADPSSGEIGASSKVTEDHNPDVSGEQDEQALRVFVQQRLRESLAALQAFSKRNEDCAPWVKNLTRNVQTDLELTEDNIPDEDLSLNGALAPIKAPIEVM